MSAVLIILVFTAYMAALFGIAYWAEHRARIGRSVIQSPLVYALSLAVYCTAWTFYGSVGRAANQGVGFLPIYLGPTSMAPLWMMVLKKMVHVSKAQRITSVADFISARYGKSTSLGVVATLVAVIGIIPYISIQLKAIVSSFAVLMGPAFRQSPHIYLDAALYVAIALAVFAMLFGTRRLDPNEHHEGLIAAIAMESVVKLIAFLAVGIFVTFFLYQGVDDLFSQGALVPEIEKRFYFAGSDIDGTQWFFLTLISMTAILLLPRQFHVAVVENTHPSFIRKASWLFPLYLLLINIFVLPVAVAGLLQFPDGTVNPDTFVLSLPLAHGKSILAIIVAVGGFSAATGMVIIAVLALSIMISNNLVLPVLLQPRFLERNTAEDLSPRLLGIRRISIVIVLLLTFAYLKSLAANYTLVSIGLISFTAVAQFAPSVIGGLYWKGATKSGAMAGLLVGFLIWAYTLILPTWVDSGLLPAQLMAEGPAGISWLKPQALFGLHYLDPISHAAFWSLLFNLSLFGIVSLRTTQDPLEVAQADIFVEVYNYDAAAGNPEGLRRSARVSDLFMLLQRFLGQSRADMLKDRFSKDINPQSIAPAELLQFVEVQLSGAIGAASAKLIISSVTKDDPISLEEMFTALDHTREAVAYSKALEQKSSELEQLTQQLKQANLQLQELDRMKADFITTVTHELRTPITAIKAIAKILQDHPDLPTPKQQEFLNILISESERISRLINQVLDLEKLQASNAAGQTEILNFSEILIHAVHGLQPLMDEKAIQCHLFTPAMPLFVVGHNDRMTQVIVNLLSNAIKFCHPTGGIIHVRLHSRKGILMLDVADNGPGIPPDQHTIIFERFTQLQGPQHNKPQGSGLGLYITRTIVEDHGGSIDVLASKLGGALFRISLPLYRS